MGTWIDPQRPSHMKILQQRVETAGIHHRAADARRFIDSGGERRLDLEPEPTNLHDPNAIKVIGVTGGWRIHIGYVPADLARSIVDGQMWPDVFADLRMVDSGDYVHVVFDLCVPKGSGERKPKNTIPDDEKIVEFKKEVRKAERSHSYYQKEYGCKGGLSVHPYTKLAVVCRKQKDY